MTSDREHNKPAGKLPIVALLTANAISMVGNNLGLVAVPWFVLETTGSAARSGVVAFAIVLPTVLAAILGGALVDRVGNKRISVLADLVSGVTVACIPLLHVAVGIEFWQLTLLVFLGALLDAPGNTARMAVVPHLAEIGGMSLERANGAAQAIQSSSVLLGPPLAGLLIAWLGPTDVLWLNAGSFVVSAAIVSCLVPEIERAAKTAGRYLEDVREGLAFIKRDPFLLSLLSIGAIANFAGAPLFAVALPVFAREVYGDATDLGLILGGVGAGSLLGAVAFGSIGTRYPRRMLAIAFSIASACPVALLAFEPPIWIAVGAMAVSGLGDGVVNPLIITVIHERVPLELRGRVIGSMLACILAAAPIGMLLAGWAVAPFGINGVILAIAGMLMLVTLLFSRMPSLRQIEASAVVAKPVATI
jgi:MFS family permease